MINNEDIIKVAFYDELEKIAINIRELRKANSAIKDKVVGKSMFDVYGARKKQQIEYSGFLKRMNGAGLHTIPTRDITKQIALAKADETYGAIESKKKTTYIKKFHKELNKQNPNIHGKIYQGKGGSIAATNKLGLDGLLDNIPNAKRLSNKNKEIVNRVGLAHEGFELSTKNPMMFGSHMHPSVIFKENNIVATLPKKNQAAKNYLTKIRETGSEAAIFPKEMPYGKQRFSRHAIKRLTENMEMINKRIENNAGL